MREGESGGEDQLGARGQLDSSSPPSSARGSLSKTESPPSQAPAPFLSAPMIPPLLIVGVVVVGVTTCVALSIALPALKDAYEQHSERKRESKEKRWREEAHSSAVRSTPAPFLRRRRGGGSEVCRLSHLPPLPANPGTAQKNGVLDKDPFTLGDSDQDPHQPSPATPGLSSRSTSPTLGAPLSSSCSTADLFSPMSSPMLVSEDPGSPRWDLVEGIELDQWRGGRSAGSLSEGGWETLEGEEGSSGRGQLRG